MRPIMLKNYELVNSFIDRETADNYFGQLLDLPWQQVTWSTGKPLPRLVYQATDGGGVLDELRRLVENNFGIPIRGIWCNQYRNGADYTPEHQDSYGGYVFTISFGATRRFIFRNIKTSEKIELLPEHGDLYYFSPSMNNTHKHSVPKIRAREDNGMRISVVLFA